MKNIMIDIETLGTRPGSVIVSIGACSFDPADIESVGKHEFYVNIDSDDSKSLGLTTDQDTLNWWAKQDPATMELLKDNKQQLVDALNQFSQWWAMSGCKYPWSHGATFDLVLLEAAYALAGLKCPFKYFNAHDTRTVYHWARVSPDRKVGTHHYALDDAKNQAVAVCKAWAVMRPDVGSTE